MNYSILMSVYYKENAEFLKESINSMLTQTVLTNDFVLVCDGSLTPALDAVIDDFVKSHFGLFQIVRLPKNLGIGGAASEGLKYCKNELVAKMDADDISCNNRCGQQVKVFEENSEVSIIGGQMEEFTNSPDDPIAIRRVPILHEDIKEFAKRRMPFNNITVMYRKSAVERVGSYSLDLNRCEDYELYARMINNGCTARNLDCILCKARVNPNALQRRGSWINLKGFVIARWRIHRSGFSNFMDFIIPCCAQLILTISPNKLRYLIYKKLLR